MHGFVKTRGDTGQAARWKAITHQMPTSHLLKHTFKAIKAVIAFNTVIAAQGLHLVQQCIALPCTV
eukprot:1157775-Pelagomonas_calceolata.AAC.15